MRPSHAEAGMGGAWGKLVLDGSTRKAGRLEAFRLDASGVFLVTSYWFDLVWSFFRWLGGKHLVPNLQVILQLREAYKALAAHYKQAWGHSTSFPQGGWIDS